MPVPPELQGPKVARAAALFGHLSELGVTHAVLAPGSRSTPLALGLAASSLTRTVVPEERAAAFFALGRARASGCPVVIITTSGTAAIETLPAVAEASVGAVPLIVVTADRPRRLLAAGAPQTLDQVRPFAGLVRRQVALDLDSGTEPSDLGSIAAELVRAATGANGPPGPVHLNAGFAEPLLAKELAPRPRSRTPRLMGGRQRALAAAEARALFDPTRQGCFVVGGPIEDPGSLREIAWRLGWPVIADARARVPAGGPVLSHGELLARGHVPLPSVVVVIGDYPLARPLLGMLRRVVEAGGELISWSPEGTFRDPLRLATGFVDADLAATLAARLVELDAGQRAVPLVAADGVVEAAVAAEAAASARSEVAVTRALVAGLRAEESLFVSASLPLRYIDWYRPPLAHPPRVLANRGANGIDGVVASYLGVASAESSLAALLVGDLAARYDLGAFVCLPPPRAGLVVVLDNAGGLIFDTVAPAALIDPVLETELFVTPPAEPVADLLTGLGLPTVEFEEAGEVEELLARARAGSFLVAVHRSSRSAEREALARLDRAVDQALGRITAWT